LIKYNNYSFMPFKYIKVQPVTCPPEPPDMPTLFALNRQKLIIGGVGGESWVFWGSGYTRGLVRRAATSETRRP